VRADAATEMAYGPEFCPIGALIPSKQTVMIPIATTGNNSWVTAPIFKVDIAVAQKPVELGIPKAGMLPEAKSANPRQ